MALRKGSAYSKKYARPFTRKSKVRKKSYIKALPNSRIVKYKMGDVVGYEKGDYPLRLEIIAKERAQIRDTSLESVRQFLNRFLQTKVGKEFYLELKVAPHHVLRENKMLTGAGADRMQTGMSRAFGKSAGRAAIVRPGQTIFVIGLKDTRQEAAARKLVKSSKSRLPCRISAQTV